MGNCCSSTSNANKAKLQRLIAQAEELGLESQVRTKQALNVGIEETILLIQSDIEIILEERKKTEEEKEKRGGVYWHTIDDVWNEENMSFGGKYQVFKDLRKETIFYKRYRDELDKGVEVKTILKRHDSIAASFATCSSMQSTSQRDTESQPSNNRKKNIKHESELNKNITGTLKGKSRAHLVPKDKDCNPFWQKAVEVVTGAPDDWGVDDKGKKCIQKLLEIVVQLKANRLTFRHEHNHYFDTMKEGIILVIPLFESMEEMAKWDYKKKGYEALIVASSKDAYTGLGFTDASQMSDATKDDVERGIKLLSSSVKLLADSLVIHWDNHFATFTEESQQSRKQMLGKMKERLETDNFVKIPSFTRDSSWEPKLIKIDFDNLYEDEEAKHYIPDPFLLLLKTASNWSFKAYHSIEYKLLPACSSSVSDSDDSSLSLFLSGVQQVFNNNFDLVGQEISIVTDDEQEIDDKASIFSELSGGEE